MKMGFINAQQLRRLGEALQLNGYGDYLRQLLNEK